MPGFSGKQPIDLVGIPIYTDDLVQYGKRTAQVLITLDDTALLMEFDGASTRPTDTIEQMWLYKPFDCIVRTGALSPIS